MTSMSYISYRRNNNASSRGSSASTTRTNNTHNTSKVSGNGNGNGNDDDLFDTIVFRDTAGAPKSFTSYASMQGQSNPNTDHNHNQLGSTRSPAHNAALLESLKPRVSVKLFIHEEVASTQDKKSSLDEISSHVLLDGAVYVSLLVFFSDFQQG